MTVEPVAWWQAEPRRLRRDRDEVTLAFPELAFVEQGQAGWAGRLPAWPFDRPEPPGLRDLVPDGLDLVLGYGAAYPVVSPMIYPVDPAPLPLELTQARWHVLGNRALCLFQTQADWDPASSVVDLLRRAAGWRVEYALLKAELLDDMSLTGIVTDDSLDPLITTAAARLVQDPRPGVPPAPPAVDP